MTKRPSLAAIVLAALCCLVSWQALAQTADLPYCYSNTCYATLGEAEAALRASVAEGSNMKDTGRDTVLSTSVVVKHYAAVPRLEPEKIWGYGYMTQFMVGASSSPPAARPGYCTTSGSPYTGGTCADLIEMLEAFIADKMATLDPSRNCVAEPPQVTGAFIEPYYAYNNPPGDWNFLSSHGKYWSFYYNCNDGRHQYPGGTGYTISRYQDYKCPAGYHTISDTAEAHAAWPKICASGTERTIRVLNRKRCDPCQAVSDKPIYPSTGDKARFEHDFEFGGRAFTRNYHSVMQFDNSSLSPGWSTSFGMRLHQSTDGYKNDYDFTSADGFVDRFDKMESGLTEVRSKYGSGRILRKFVVDSVVSYELIERNGDVLYFNAAGDLQAITNPATPERDLSFAYVDGKLDTVADALGRELSFEYASGRLSRVVLPDGAAVGYGYDSDDNLVAVDYGNGQVKRYHYKEDAPIIGDAGGAAADGEPYALTGFRHLLTGITSEDGQRYATFKYDLLDRPVYSGLHTASGAVNVTTAEYGAGTPKVVTVTQETGEVRKYTYSSDEKPRLTKIESVTDAGRLQVFEHDSLGRVTKAVAAKGTPREVTTLYSYSGSNKSVTSAAGKAEQSTAAIDRSPLTNLPLETRQYDAAGTLIAKTTSTYNLRGQVTDMTRTDPVRGISRTTSFTYCESGDVGTTCPKLGQLVAVNGERTDVNDISTFAYYAADHADCAASPATCSYRTGDLWKTANALGHVTEMLKYDGAGRPLSIKDANGVVTDLEYHARGWLTARKVRGSDAGSESDDQITRIEYYPTGLVKKTTLPDGSFTTFTYDGAHRLTAIADAEGNAIRYTLDSAGNRTAEKIWAAGVDHTDPAKQPLRKLEQTFNTLGELVTLTNATGNEVHLGYDVTGNQNLSIAEPTPTTATNAVSEYDPLNRLVKTIQDDLGLKVTTAFKYDAQDNLVEVVDPKNLSTKYAYNGLGDLTQLTSPDTGITTYTYDSAGNRKTQTDARGITATYGYDALNRLTSVTYPTASLSTTYTYDVANGACATDERFAKGQLTRILNGYSDTQYCYNRFGQLTRKQQSTNGKTFTVRYGYTRSGNLSSVTYPDGTVADYVRDELGRAFEVGVTRPGGARQKLLTAASYYPFGPAQEWVFGNGRLFQRTLNQNYQPGVVQDQSAGGLSFGYEFDGVGNLVTLRDGNQAEPPKRKYQYDALNRLTQTSNGSTESLLEAYTYDATGNRLSVTDNGVTSTYTMAGASHRVFNANGLARGYDAVGNTTSIGGTARQFTYDDANRMNYVKRNGVGVQYYAYNGKGEQVRRYYSGSDNVYTVYDEAGQWLGEYDNAGNAVQQVIWLDNLPVGLIVGSPAANNPLHYIEADALGTPRRIIETGRDVAVWNWPLTGEAFGNDAPIEDADADGVAFVFNLRFPGQRYDAATGLNYNYFRDYDASSGRYVESDPIGIDGGISTFAYVSGNPFVLTDPRGLKCGSGQVTVWSWDSLVPRSHCASSANPSGNFPYSNPTGEAAFHGPETNTPWGNCQGDCLLDYVGFDPKELVRDEAAKRGIGKVFWGAAKETMQAFAKLATFLYDTAKYANCIKKCEGLDGQCK